MIISISIAHDVFGVVVQIPLARLHFEAAGLIPRHPAIVVSPGFARTATAATWISPLTSETLSVLVRFYVCADEKNNRDNEVLHDGVAEDELVVRQIGFLWFRFCLSLVARGRGQP